MGIAWEESDVAAQNRWKWHQSVAQCIHFDVGWIKVKGRRFNQPTNYVTLVVDTVKVKQLVNISLHIKHAFQCMSLFKNKSQKLFQSHTPTGNVMSVYIEQFSMYELKDWKVNKNNMNRQSLNVSWLENNINNILAAFLL